MEFGEISSMSSIVQWPTKTSILGSIPLLDTRKFGTDPSYLCVDDRDSCTDVAQVYFAQIGQNGGPHRIAATVTMSSSEMNLLGLILSRGHFKTCHATKRGQYFVKFPVLSGSYCSLSRLMTLSSDLLLPLENRPPHPLFVMVSHKPLADMFSDVQML